MNFAPDSLEAKDVRYTIHHFTNLDKHQTVGPFVVTRGEGIYIWDNHGNQYIDALAGAWCTSLGYNESRLVEAAARQMREMPYSHTFGHRTAVPTVELAEKLRSLGYVTAILSDQTDWLDELDQRDHFYRCFDRIYNSYYLGKGKRDLSHFREIAKDLKIPPSSIVFVDDSAANVATAAGAGMLEMTKSTGPP